MGFKSTLDIDARINSQVSSIAFNGAKAAAQAIKNNLGTAGGSRTGKRYARLPRRSSANIDDLEYPATQSGSLARSIGVRLGGSSRAYKVGSFGEDAGKVRALEFGNVRRNFAARSPIQRTLIDPQTQKEMLDAAIKII